MAECVEAIEFCEATPERCADLARLFEGRGGPSYCWCMAWRRCGGRNAAVHSTFAACFGEVGHNARRRSVMRLVLRHASVGTCRS